MATEQGNAVVGAQPEDDRETGLPRLLAIIMSARLVVDTAAQIFNPFLGVIAAGMGLSAVQLGRLVGLRSFMGLLAPVAGVMGDRRGYRLVLRVALLLTAAGLVVVGVSNSLPVAVLGMVLLGAGMSSFVPTLQAYLSGRLPYAQRARAMGIVEYAWALTGIVSLPLMGLLIEATSWRAPFFLLAAGCVAMSFVFAALPSARAGRGPQAQPAARPRRSLRQWGAAAARFVDLSPNARSAWATIAAGSLVFFAAVQVMITHGYWLGSRYGLSPAQLGTVALVFGLFDLAASVLVSIFTDSFGKKRSVVLGGLVALAGYAALPWLDRGVVWAVLGLAVARFGFEFAVVANLPLLSEQLPAQRGKLMSLAAAISLVSNTVAGFTGPWLFTQYGVGALAWSSAAAMVISLAIMITLVREHIPGASPNA